MTDELVTDSADMPLRKAIRTMTDVIRHHTDLLHDVHRIEEGRSRWTDP